MERDLSWAGRLARPLPVSPPERNALCSESSNQARFAMGGFPQVALLATLPYREGMQSDRRYDVAIAGGGFAGRTLALALTRLAPKCFRIALIDAEAPQAEVPQDARALALSAASKSLLAVLELWPALAPNAQAIESIEITDSPLNAVLRPYFL